MNITPEMREEYAAYRGRNKFTDDDIRQHYGKPRRDGADKWKYDGNITQEMRDRYALAYGKTGNDRDIEDFAKGRQKSTDYTHQKI